MRWSRRWLKEILDGADQLVPVDTGALKESGHGEERRGGASANPAAAGSMPGPDGARHGDPSNGP